MFRGSNRRIWYIMRCIPIVAGMDSSSSSPSTLPDSCSFSFALSLLFLWGPLHTRAKSRDHDIYCESPKESECPKATVPTHLWNHVVWSRTLKCSVKSYVTGSSTKCYLNEFLFMWILKHDKKNFKILNSIVVSVWSAMVSWFCVRSTSERWFLKIIQVTMKQDPFDVV
jgi:hypothetical protein